MSIRHSSGKTPSTSHVGVMTLTSFQETLRLHLETQQETDVDCADVIQVFVECPPSVRLRPRQWVYGTGSLGFQIQVGDFDDQQHIINSDDC